MLKEEAVEANKILSALSGLIFIAAFFPYIRSILRGETKPAKASWVIWASLDTITFAGMLIRDTLNGQILAAIVGAWTVVVFAWKYGTPCWTKLDKFCLSGAVLGIALWQIFDSPELGILTSLSVVFLGSIPTFVSAWQDPGRENAVAWILYWVSCMVALLAIPAWTLADAAQPVCFSAIETIMMFILFVKPRFKKWAR